LKISIGTRGSRLALAQTELVKDRILQKHPGLQIEVRVIRTTGDKILDTPLSRMGGRGLFTQELEEALLDGRVDLVVHSMKDLPTELPPGLAVGAVLEREDPADVFVSGGLSWDQLPENAVIGTSSLRRRAQLLAQRPGLDCRDLRGNVDTRLRKLSEGLYQGVVLARAGLKRLSLLDGLNVRPFPVHELVPAVAQGALAVEIRRRDKKTAEIVGAMEHAETRLCVTVERDFLARVGGGCQVPAAAHCRIKADTLTLWTFVGDLEGKKYIREKFTAPVSGHAALGTNAADKVLNKGGRDIVKRVFESLGPLPLAGKTVAVTQAMHQNKRQIALIQSLGGRALEWPAIAIRPVMTAEQFRGKLGALKGADFIIFTSANAVQVFFDLCAGTGADPQAFRKAKICAIGSATADALAEGGLPPSITPATFDQEGLVAALPGDFKDRQVIIPRAREARPLLEKTLKARNARVEILALYETVAFEGSAPGRPGPYDFITFTSPSCVSHFFKAAALAQDAETVCIGQVTAGALKALGLPCHVLAAEATVEGMVQAMARYVQDSNPNQAG
jgi:hydroxymethylbilane synthase